MNAMHTSICLPNPCILKHDFVLEEQRASDEPTDGLGRVISDAKRECETENEKLKMKAMLKDHKTLATKRITLVNFGIINFKWEESNMDFSSM